MSGNSVDLDMLTKAQLKRLLINQGNQLLEADTLKRNMIRHMGRLKLEIRQKENLLAAQEREIFYISNELEELKESLVNGMGLDALKGARY